MSTQAVATANEVAKTAEVQKQPAANDQAIRSVAANTYSAANSKDYLQTFQPTANDSDSSLPDLSLTGLTKSSDNSPLLPTDDKTGVPTGTNRSANDVEADATKAAGVPSTQDSQKSVSTEHTTVTKAVAPTPTEATAKSAAPAPKSASVSNAASAPKAVSAANAVSAPKIASEPKVTSEPKVASAATAASASTASGSDINLSPTLQNVVSSMGLKATLSGPVVDNVTGYSGSGTTAKPMSEYGKPDGKGGFIIDNDPSGYGGDLAPKTSVTGTQLFVADVKFNPNTVGKATFDGGKMTSWPAVWGLSGWNASSNLNQEIDTMEYFGKANGNKPAGSTLHDWIKGDHAGSTSESSAIDPSLFNNAATQGVEIAALVDKDNNTVTTYVDGQQTAKFQLKAGDPALTTPMNWILGTGDGEAMDVTNMQIYTPGSGSQNDNPGSAAVLKRATGLNNQLTQDAGDLNGNDSQLTSEDNSIRQQDLADAAANGGQITSQEYNQLNSQESSLSSQISSDNYGAGDAQFQAAHSFRSNVLGLNASLSDQINQDMGDLNGNYSKLLSQDNSIRQQEQTDAINDGGHITDQEYSQLKSEENSLSSQISSDNYGFGDAQFRAARPLRSEVLGLYSNLSNQINQDKSGLSGHYDQLMSEDNSIRQQEQADAASNGGALTAQEYNQLKNQETALSGDITSDYDG